MGCQTRMYTIGDGFPSIFYLGESIKSSICAIDNQFKSLVGGKRKKTRRRTRKRRKTLRKH